MPFETETLIGFNIPVDAAATLTITDVQGRLLSMIEVDAAAGYNTINVTRDMIQGATGVLAYTLTSIEYTATKKMVVIR